MNDRIVMLSEDTMFTDQTGAGILRNRCAFTSRDMGADWPEAFTYAVVFGWHDDEHPEDDATDEIARKHAWDDELISFLRETHERFKLLTDRRAENSSS